MLLPSAEALILYHFLFTTSQKSGKSAIKP